MTIGLRVASHRRAAQLLAVLWVLAAPWKSLATGPSFLSVYAEPIAVSTDGAVALKSYSTGNAMGAHSRLALHSRSCWICVTESGTWHERSFSEVTWESSGISKKLPWEEQERLYVRQFEDAQVAFENPVPLDDPPEKLEELLEKCSQGAWRRIDPQLGEGRATWSPDRFCLDGRCVDQSVLQRTIGGLESRTGEGQTESTFVHGRIALFHNRDDYHLPPFGASFLIDNPSCGRCTYDGMEIFGVSIIPLSLEGSVEAREDDRHLPRRKR